MSGQAGSGVKSTAFKPPLAPLLVFTDLDGTLLDHTDYSYAAAQPALTRLAELHVPLIPTTSKTLAEVTELQLTLGNKHPCILENGGALCIPPQYFDGNTDSPDDEGYCRIVTLGPSYTEIISLLAQIRAHSGWRFTGFSDMDEQTIAEQTGLSLNAAALAQQRLCSEPLLWQDSDTAMDDFKRRLAGHCLTLTRGGRFWHVMGRTNKASAMQRLCDAYRTAGFTDFSTIALGDSPNDAEMLAAANIAVIVRRHDLSRLNVQGKHRTVITDAVGPTGWNSAMLDLLQDFAPSATAQTKD